MNFSLKFNIFAAVLNAGIWGIIFDKSPDANLFWNYINLVACFLSVLNVNYIIDREKF